MLGTEAAGSFSLDVVFERADTAIEFLEESVLLDPGNAHAWAALGDAQSLLGDMEGARQAMAISAALAPTNVQLADTRLTFAALLDELVHGEFEEIESITDDEWSWITQDADVLKEYSRRRLPPADLASPRFSSIVSLTP